MGFTTSCFIRKNTSELRDRLEELGIRSFLCDEELNAIGANIKVYNGRVAAFTCSDSLNDCCDLIDCGTNEDLFLAIAALRDDTDKNQWFIADSPLSVSYDDVIGNDHYFVMDEGSVFFWNINWMHTTIILGNFHKATVNELIEYFKAKEK